MSTLGTIFTLAVCWAVGYALGLLAFDLVYSWRARLRDATTSDLSGLYRDLYHRAQSGSERYSRAQAETAVVAQEALEILSAHDEAAADELGLRLLAISEGLVAR